MTPLQRVVEAARRAVLARAGDTPGYEVGSVDQGHNFNILYENHINEFSTRSPSPYSFTRSATLLLRPNGAGDRPVQRPVELPVPIVRVSLLVPAAAGPSGPFCGPDELVASLELSVGALRIFRVLHRLACAVAQARAYGMMPDTVTLHLPQGLLALAVRYTPRHLRRLLPELVTAGLLDCGAHASKVRGMSLWDGYLWAVKVKPGDQVPHLNREAWRHPWRDFAGDINAGRTVKAVLEGMSELHADEWENAVQGTLKAWAVSPGNVNTPLLCSADMASGAGLEAAQDVREIVYRLGEVATCHASKRAALVGRLASALSTALDDRHSRRWYCAVIWQAWRGFVEGRADLQVLAGALMRVDDERRDWAELRRPAALLAARLRAA